MWRGSSPCSSAWAALPPRTAASLGAMTCARKRGSSGSISAVHQQHDVSKPLNKKALDAARAVQRRSQQQQPALQGRKARLQGLVIC